LRSISMMKEIVRWQSQDSINSLFCSFGVFTKIHSSFIYFLQHSDFYVHFHLTI